jgi:hypothetical protein
MIDPRQSDKYVSCMRRHGNTMIRPGKTWMVVYSGPIISTEYPPEPIEDVLRDIAALNPIQVYILHDVMYSGSKLIGDRWVGKRFEYCSSRVMFDGKSIGDVWHGQTREQRHACRAAIKRGVVAGISPDFPTFFRMYTELGKTKGFGTSEGTAIWRAWMEGEAKVWMATVDGQPAATALVEYSPSAARFCYGAGAPKYYRFRPSNYLHWRIIADAYNSGLKLYDLGGGHNRFKAGFGSVTFPYERLEWSKDDGEMLRL